VSRKNLRQLEVLCALIFVATDPEEGRLYPRQQDRISRVLELKPHVSDTEVRQADQEFAQLASDAKAVTAH